MGSQGRRKGRRVRSDEGTVHVSPSADWGTEHSPYTVEGQLELNQRIVDNVNYQRRWGRMTTRWWVALAFIMLPLGLALWQLIEIVRSVFD